MSIFIEKCVIFLTFFSPAQLMYNTYTLKWLDVNAGQVVYKQNVQLAEIGHKLYKLTSSEGERTFRLWDFVTMIGVYVEFDTYDSNRKVQCNFDTIMMPRHLHRSVKPNIHPMVIFPMISTQMVLEKPIGSLFRMVSEANLVVETRSRFYIQSGPVNEVMIIFSCGFINVSSVLPGGRILLVVQTYEMEIDDTLPIRFILTFFNHIVAQQFHDYITKEERFCLDYSISAVVPDFVTL